eukprot:TRINITY_DN8655_c0_g1_i3.p1 TRINITY_DN8655_c0_g1~~TRINITY_DN8655_c0_g1_i3.p1  ORF type:complete len:582 (+),score=94.72 TRINITY_DN8655_c0_g1_i3:131-1876(+)
MCKMQVIVFFGLLLVDYSFAAQCRMSYKADHSECGLPLELSNFQGYHECSDEVWVGRPKTKEQLQELVRTFDRVKGVGVGHSWWKEQFCSGADSASINMVMTELDNVIPSFNQFDMEEAITDDKFPIQVSQDETTVTVSAGVSQRVVLDFLAKFRGETFKGGYTLQAFSWFIDQTIGGAVATGTHGSSITHASLSNQLVSMKMVVANGSEISISRSENEHLWKAAMVSVGRLGIITELNFKIVQQKSVQRRLEDISIVELIEKLRTFEMEYKLAQQTGDETKVWDVIKQFDETQIFWFIPTQAVWYITFNHLDVEPAAVLQNDLEFSGGYYGAIQDTKEFDLPEGVYAQQETNTNKGRPNILVRASPQLYSNQVATFLRGQLNSGTFASRKAYLSMSEGGNTYHAEWNDYEQYEVSIPLESSAECLEGLVKELYGPRRLYEGFRSPALVRFVGEEDAYISNTNGGPRMYVNIEDHLIHNGRNNQQFQEVMKHFLQNCDARLHWGKAGWPDLLPCFDGASQYQHWCDFGCAVEELDPTGKFQSQSNVWMWRAQKNGEDVPFFQCCDSSGFSSQCTCAIRDDC